VLVRRRTDHHTPRLREAIQKFLALT
jgi:hypothetical protein